MYFHKDKTFSIIRKKNCHPWPFRSYLHQFAAGAESCFAGGKSLVLIYIDIKEFHIVEQVSGSGAAEKALKCMEDLLKKKVPGMIPAGQEILAVDKLLGDEFIAIYSYSGFPGLEELENIKMSWRLGLREDLNRAMFSEVGRELDIHVGSVAISPETPGNVEVKMYSAIREARMNAQGMEDPKNARLLEEFSLLLEKRNFKIEYQPIVSLSNGSVLGWEALTRGPRDSHFQSPNVIFSFAAEVNLLFTVERICRCLAVERLGEIGFDQKVFLNINPLTISDPSFVRGETAKIIEETGLRQRNIVFEITEQADLRSLPRFKRTLEHYRGQGYMVAIDDAGAGFSSLQAIAQVRPEYIKIDMSLVRGVDTDPVKRAMLETFVTFADKIGSFIIAEGIETENEFRALIKMGVHYGQGYYLGRPAYPRSMPDTDICLNIARLSSRSLQLAWRHSMPVADILEDCTVVNPGDSVGTVMKKFESDTSLNGVVVVEGGRPLGLVMRQALYSQLSTQYGVALYSKRPIRIVMDRFLMAIDAHTPVEIASQVAMSREKSNVYDNIIITRNGQYIGVVTVQNLINSLTRIQLEFAKGANPLTGLPGNNAIEEALSERLTGNKPFVLVYVDLDYFKSYNDRYGFDNGDRLLLFTSKIVTGVIRKYGEGDDFIGHLGGDDFVMITSPARVDLICTRLIKYFDRLVRGYYPLEDRLNGGVTGRDRDGRERWFPFVSVSMSLVECFNSLEYNLSTISRKAAELKRFAKSLPGSVYVRDRRSQD